MRWNKAVLGEVTDSCLGKMLDQEKNRGTYQPYLANLNVRWGSFDLDELPEMRFGDDEQERYGLEYGDLVLCEGGEPGRCALWKNAIPNMKIQKALHRVRTHDCLDNRYLYYWFLLAGKTGELDQYFTGATIKHMPGQKLKSIVIDMPPLDTQRRIADILSAYDDLIENNQKQIKLLEEAAQRLYREWFVELLFPGYETTPVVDGVPEGWVRTNINALMTFHRGYDLTKDSMISGEYPVVGSTSVIGYHNEYKAEGPGIVTGRSGSLGTYQLVWNNYWPHNTALYISDYKGHHVLYLYAMLKTVDFATLNNGGAIPTLNRNVLSNVLVVEAPIELQNRYVDAVQPMFDKIKSLTEIVVLATDARDRLLPKLMSGEVEV